MALLLGVVLFWQPWHATAMAAATGMAMPICTAEGMKLVDANGNPVDIATSHHHGGDCCCPSAVTINSGTLVVTPLTTARFGPAAALPAGWRNAEWLGKLSRGPPSLQT
jgi:hypothetical protein